MTRRVLPGIAAAPGVAVGPAVVIDSARQPLRRHHIDADEISYEVKRLKTAIERSRNELEHIRTRLGQGAPADYRLILDAHLMMHRDELLIDAATERICDDRVNAEWAVERAVGRIADHLAASKVDYFRDRATDVEHVGNRIIAQLVGRASSLPPMLADSVVVLEDLSPADAAQLIQTPVAALVTSLGSATSHTAILARTLEIPSVVGVHGVLEHVGSGDRLIVDALRGEVILEPEDAECRAAHERAARYRDFTDRLRTEGPSETETADGVAFELMANVDLPAEAALALEERADGIGLYRTEFLFMNRATPPDEEEQAVVYSDIVNVVAPRWVTIRTIDMGGDSLTLDPHVERRPNPALGQRSIRLSLSHPEMLEAQLRAALRAAALGPVRIMFPLIAGLMELRRARACLERAEADLRARGVEYGPAQVGAMVELPSAVMVADRLARECDFLSVGTNDLLQYAFAVDRANPDVAHLADPLDPGLLALLARVAEAAAAHDTPVAICGDMAADVLALPLLVGLGYRSLSVPVSAVPIVREVLHRIASAEAAEAVELALVADTASEVRDMLVRRFEPALGDLWSEAGVDVTTAARW